MLRGPSLLYVQFVSLNISLTSVSPRKLYHTEVLFPSIKASGSYDQRSGKCVSSKPESFGYQSPMLMVPFSMTMCLIVYSSSKGTVQSLIKERDNAKMEYKKLFDSIKKTRSQTQKEMDELITHVCEKTYSYGVIRAENQNLLVTISELKARMKNGENGKSVNTNFDKAHGS
ncbi:hypothetical protein Tco_1142790 [Tanacetum coccineum]